MSDDQFFTWMLCAIFFPAILAVLVLSLGKRGSRGHFLWYLLPSLVNAVLYQVGELLWLPVITWASSGLDDTAVLSVLGVLYVLGVTMPIVFARGYRITAVVVSVVTLALTYPGLAPIV